MTSTCVALLDSNEHLLVQTEQALTEQGLTVYGCSDLASLYRVLEREPTHAVMLRRTGPCAALVDVLLPQLRSTYPLSIVVESPDCSVEDRLNTLSAGADVCLDHIYDTRELAALLCAQARRWVHGGRMLAGEKERLTSAGAADESSLYGSTSLPHASGTASRPILAGPEGRGRSVDAEVWRLLYQGWVLVTPTGHQLSLTGVERSFFLALANDERHELSREALAKDKFKLNFKSISVAISRLRKKVQKAGVRLPLHTVHGMGYVFIGQLKAQDFA